MSLARSFCLGIGVSCLWGTALALMPTAAPLTDREEATVEPPTGELELFHRLERSLWDLEGNGAEDLSFLVSPLREGSVPMRHERFHGPDGLPPFLLMAIPPRAKGQFSSRDISWPDQKRFDIPVRWDPKVQRYIDLFLGRARGTFTAWLRRMEVYRPYVIRTLEREGLPRDLIYVAMIESGFNPKALSRAKASGIWQFISSTGRSYDLEVSAWVDERRDPYRATEAAVRFFKDLYGRFGSWPLAMAGYNAGPGCVLRAIRRYNTNDYFELTRYGQLPKETSYYVPKVMAAAIVAKNLSRFGLTAPQQRPLRVARVIVNGGVSLEALSRTLGVSRGELAELNPHLRRGRTPPGRETGIYVPEPLAAVAQERIKRLPQGQDRFVEHRVRQGETLQGLAKRAGTSARALASLNTISPRHILKAGDRIMLPKAAPAPPDPEEPIVVVVPPKAFSYPDRKRVFYRVQSSDSLEEIASALGVWPSDLAIWNGMDAKARVHSDMVLQAFIKKDKTLDHVVLLEEASVKVLRRGSPEAGEHADALKRKQGRKGRRPKAKTTCDYKVARGDSLWKVASRFKITIPKLRQINGLKQGQSLSVGQSLKVCAPKGKPRKRKGR